MKTQIRKPRVEPGIHTWKFTREEIRDIVFLAIFNRKPTEEEIQRLTINTNDYPDRGNESEWLGLSLTDIPPTLSGVAQS